MIDDTHAYQICPVVFTFFGFFKIRSCNGDGITLPSFGLVTTVAADELNLQFFVIHYLAGFNLNFDTLFVFDQVPNTIIQQTVEVFGIATYLDPTFNAHCTTNKTHGD